MMQVAEFQDNHPQGYIIQELPQEVWPFLETGRCHKTFEIKRELGSGGCGTVLEVRHKLDNRVYALKKVPLHTRFEINC